MFQCAPKDLTMRFVGVVLLLSAVVAAKEQSTSFTVSESDIQIFEKCIKEAGFTDKEISDTDGEHSKSADRKVKCFDRCLFKAYNVLKDDGTIDLDAAIKYYHVEENEADKTRLAECSKNARGDDDCEKAHAVESCFRSWANKR